MPNSLTTDQPVIGIWGWNEAAETVVSALKPAYEICLLGRDLLKVERIANGFEILALTKEVPLGFHCDALMLFPDGSLDRTQFTELLCAEYRETILIQAGYLGPVLFRNCLEAAKMLAEAGFKVVVRSEEILVTAADAEAAYYSAQEQGVLFVRTSHSSVLCPTDVGLRLEINDPVLKGKRTSIGIDRVITPRNNTDSMYQTLASKLGLGTKNIQNPDPFGTIRKGIWVIQTEAMPMAAAPEAMAAAVRASLDGYLSSRNQTETVYTVDPAGCALCLTCFRVCPHKAFYRLETDANLYHAAMAIDPVACDRCGLCAAECPAQTIRAAEKEIQPHQPPLCVACENAAAGLGEREDLLRRPCAGAVSAAEMLNLMADHGPDRDLVVLTCHSGKCRHQYGNERLTARAVRVNQILKNCGVTGRVIVVRTSAQENWAGIERSKGVKP
ncbi:MAG: hydrogenase iron-sulfur subunit [Solirubrobacterales bacterium]